MVAQDFTVLKCEADNSLCSCDEESNSTQLVVSHLAAKTPANQHAGAGASDSVLSLACFFWTVMLIYIQERGIHAQKTCEPSLHENSSWRSVTILILNCENMRN